METSSSLRAIHSHNPNNLYGVDQLLPVDEDSRAALAEQPYRQKEIDYLLDSDSMPRSNMKADQFTAEYSGEEI